MALACTGMTVTRCALAVVFRKGKSEFYRGVQMDMNLLPKIQVDVVVSKVAPEKVIATARKAAVYRTVLGDGEDVCLQCSECH